MDTKTIEDFANKLKYTQQIIDDLTDIEDTGTCNLDTVMFNFKGWRKKDIEKLSNLSGLRVTEKLTGFWSGYSFIFFRTDGQANKHSISVEIANKTLNNLGIKSSVFYQID